MIQLPDSTESVSSTKTQHQVKGAFLLNVVVRKSPAILQLFASEDEALLIGRDPFFVLNLGLNVVDGI